MLGQRAIAVHPWSSITYALNTSLKLAKLRNRNLQDKAECQKLVKAGDDNGWLISECPILISNHPLGSVFIVHSSTMAALVEEPPRIAILEADVLMPELEAQFGRYGDIFTQLLTIGATAASLPTPKTTFWGIMNNPESYPEPSEFDAILVTGSRIQL